MAYRWFANDAISFAKSLDWPSATGPRAPHVPRAVQQAGTDAVSSVCYCTRTSRTPFRPCSPRQRAAAPRPLWLLPRGLPGKGELQQRGVKLYVTCGRPAARAFWPRPVRVQPGKGFHLHRWPPPSTTAVRRQPTRDGRQDAGEGVGKLRLFIQDPDTFKGGRRQEISVAGRSSGSSRDSRRQGVNAS